MHKLIASILLVAFIGQSFNQGWYYVGYVIEQKEYIKRCENKAVPELHCNGKCQLMKKIKEQGDQQAPELKIAKSDVLSSYCSFPYLIPKPLSTQKLFYLTANSGKPLDHPVSLFHPPGNFS